MFLRKLIGIHGLEKNILNTIFQMFPVLTA